jgi:hypothetical protein
MLRGEHSRPRDSRPATSSRRRRDRSDRSLSPGRRSRQERSPSPGPRASRRAFQMDTKHVTPLSQPERANPALRTAPSVRVVDWKHSEIPSEARASVAPRPGSTSLSEAERLDELHLALARLVCMLSDLTGIVRTLADAHVSRQRQAHQQEDSARESDSATSASDIE